MGWFSILLLCPCLALASTVVLSPPRLAGATFDTVPYKTGPQNVGFDKIELVWYRPSYLGEECKASTLPVTAQGIQALVLLGMTSTCWTETVANAAAAKGFSAVISPGIYHRVGCSCSNDWNSNTATIPIFEVYVNAHGFEENVTDILRLAPSVGQCTRSWVLNQIPAWIVGAGAATFKMVVCIRALVKTEIAAIYSSRQITSAQAVLIIELITAYCAILMSIDFMGLNHIFPMSIWFPALNLQYVLTFCSTYILAICMVSIEAEIKGTLFTRKLILHLGFGIFVMINICTFAAVGYRFYQNYMFIVIGLFLYFVFQSSFGMYFFVSKRRFLKMLAQGYASNNEQEKMKQLQRMSDYLYVSSIFMILYAALFIPVGVAALVHSFDLLISSMLVQYLCNVATGVVQVLSLPTKVTGVNLPTRSITTKSSQISPVPNASGVQVAGAMSSISSDQADPSPSPNIEMHALNQLSSDRHSI